MTMTLVSTVTVGAGGAASISFSGIPQSATDLFVVYSLRERVSATGILLMVLNGDSSGTYDQVRFLKGSGSTASSSTDQYTIGEMPVPATTASTFCNGSIYIPNYAGSTNKSASIDHVGENNATAAEQRITAFLRSTTPAITSLSLFPWDSFAQYSTASLYTITKGSGGATVS